MPSRSRRTGVFKDARSHAAAAKTRALAKGNLDSVLDPAKKEWTETLGQLDLGDKPDKAGPIDAKTELPLSEHDLASRAEKDARRVTNGGDPSTTTTRTLKVKESGDVALSLDSTTPRAKESEEDKAETTASRSGYVEANLLRGDGKAGVKVGGPGRD